MSAFKDMEDEPCLCLWNRYFSDFSYSKLQRDTLQESDDGDDENEVIGQLILKAYVEDLYTEQNLLYRIAKLHIRFYMEQLNLSRVAGVLRPIARIGHALKSVMGYSTLSRSMVKFGSRSSIKTNLAALIVHQLYEFLQLHNRHERQVSSSHSDRHMEDSAATTTTIEDDEEIPRQWYTSYCEMVRGRKRERERERERERKNDTECGVLYNMYV